MTLKRTLYLIRQDIMRRIYCDGNRPGALRALSVMLSPSGMAVVIFRIQSYLYACGLYPLSKLLAVMNIMLYTIEIDPRADIDEGFVLGHANGVVMHSNVTIGKNCMFMHQNGVGINKPDDRVVIEDNVVVGAGARIIGDLTIGHDSVIGMNAVLTKSIPPWSVAVGIPARVIKTREPSGGAFPSGGNAAPEETAACRRVSFAETLGLIRSDIYRRATEIDHKSFNSFSYLKLLLNPPGLAAAVYRLQHWAYCAGRPVLTKLLSILNIIAFSVDISPRVEIGPGLVLAHANGILVNGNVVIGKNCSLTLHNSLAIGPRDGMDPVRDRLVIEDNVLVGVGARVVGNITIGHHSTIGMNAVVARSLPPHSVVSGVPAREVRKNNQQGSGCDLNHDVPVGGQR